MSVEELIIRDDVSFIVKYFYERDVSLVKFQQDYIYSTFSKFNIKRRRSNDSENGSELEEPYANLHETEDDIENKVYDTYTDYTDDNM